tara:strand:- start:190 stop:780 length:591 start_codon:yes stop_codon:yes gene_type:complete
MRHISEINHCIPNSRAYWCAKCQCHSQYEFKASGSRQNQTVYYLCLHCGFHLFRPKDVKPWMNGLLGFTLLTAVLTILCGIHFYVTAIPSLFFLDEFVERNGLIVMVGLAIFTALIGLMMRKYLRDWNVWCSQQRRKSTAELETEALQHPHQPVYGDSETYFDEWASQFLSKGQVRELKLKYRPEPASEDNLLFPD